MFAVDILTDPNDFVRRSFALLESDPLRHNVVASMAERRSAELTAGAVRPEGEYWFVVREGRVVVGAGMRTDGFPPYLAPMPGAAGAAVAESLAARLDSLSGVNGDIDGAMSFARTWSRTTGLDFVTARQNRLFRLDVLRVPTGVGGHLRQAVTTDLGLIHDWTKAFHDEAGGGEHAPAVENTVRKIEHGNAWVWVDRVDGVEVPTSYTGTAVGVRGVQRIGPVYTPPSLRGRGYASAAVAGVSQRVRADGANEVCLFTDQANPTSNKIYQAIGYVPVGDTVNIAFVPAD